MTINVVVWAKQRQVIEREKVRIHFVELVEGRRDTNQQISVQVAGL